MPEQPTLARRALGLAFKRLRIEHRMSPQEGGAIIGVSRQTFMRLEDGERPTSYLEVKELCEQFGVSAEEKSRLCDLANRGQEKGWWEPYFDKGRGTTTAPKTPLFLESEQTANRIWGIETEVLPGPTQTMEYMRCIQAAGLPISGEDAASAQGLRGHRQQALDERRDFPELEFIIGFAAMHYLKQLPADVRDGQMARLHMLAARPNVTIRVTQRLHAATANSFTIVAGSEIPPFVFLDAVDGCRYVDDPDVVSLYERTFIAARESAEII